MYIINHMENFEIIYLIGIFTFVWNNERFTKQNMVLNELSKWLDYNNYN